MNRAMIDGFVSRLNKSAGGAYSAPVTGIKKLFSLVASGAKKMHPRYSGVNKYVPPPKSKQLPLGHSKPQPVKTQYYSDVPGSHPGQRSMFATDNVKIVPPKQVSLFRTTSANPNPKLKTAPRATTAKSVTVSSKAQTQAPASVATQTTPAAAVPPATPSISRTNLPPQTDMAAQGVDKKIDWKAVGNKAKTYAPVALGSAFLGSALDGDGHDNNNAHNRRDSQ